MALTKPPVLPPWAEAGDKVQPTNAELQTGWPLSNTPPARQRWNWILNFLANGVRYLTRRGLPDYGADETYMIGDRVIGDDGKTYRSIQDNNINHAPSASPLWWEEWAPSLSRLADLLQKQTYTAFTTAGAAPNFTLTPAPAITAYTAGQRFRVKFHAAGSGADVLNISGLGNKSLKQYDSTGAKVAAVIAASQLADVEYDGVDMVIIDPLPASTGITPPQFDNDFSLATTEFVRRQGLQFANYSALVGSSTLAAADFGKSFTYSGSTPFTTTLPLANTAPPGSCINFMNTATVSMTIARQGADQIYPNESGGITSLLLGPGDNVTLLSNGAGAWAVVHGSAALPYSSLFARVVGSNGYQKLPSGLIIQWGVVTTGAGGTFTWNYPVTFPNARLSEGVGMMPGNYTVIATGGGASSRSGILTVASSGAAAGSGLQFQMIAIGN